MIFLFLLLLVLAGLWCVRIWPSVSGSKTMALFFLGGIFLYYVSIPLESQILGYSRSGVGENVLQLDKSFALTLIIIANICVLGFSTGLSIFSRKIKTVSWTPCTQTQYRIPKNVIILTFGSFTLLVLFFSREIAQSGTYSGNVVTNYNNPVYAYITLLAVVATATLATIIISRNQKFTIGSIAAILAVISWGIYSSDKDAVIYGLISGFISIHIYKFRSWSYILIIPAMVVVVSLGPILFSQYRSGYFTSFNQLIDSTTSIARTGVFRHSDPAGPLFSIQESLKIKDRTWGSTYILAVLNPIPRAIWSDRPVDISEKRAKQWIRNWSPGRGLGFSPAAEGIINFGFPGIFLQYLMYGSIWALIVRIVRRMSQHRSGVLWESLYWTSGSFLLLIMHRGPFSMYTKYLILILVPFLLSWFVIDRLNWKKFVKSSGVA